MKRPALLFAGLLFWVVASSGNPPKRPRILGIARVQILTSKLPSARSFYNKVLDHPQECNWCEELPSGSFLVNPSQAIGLSGVPSPAPSDLLEEIAFVTDNVSELRSYLTAHNVPVSKPNKLQEYHLTVVDPEGHRIGFFQRPPLTERQTQALETAFPSKLRIIHAGFVVRDRSAEDRFYKDILGFRVYWHGGMKDDQTDWVDLQVPDGTDWIEYMLNVSPNADKKERGVMNHIAIGVADIKPVTERLREDNAVSILEEPQIGRDGKWQLNVYDPDDTRIEFMEFTPVQKPCCSEYTGPHPKP
jgi:catechol 2,3-dioxygenase-like lactoylglutathione lyase family enzyme